MENNPLSPTLAPNPALTDQLATFRALIEHSSDVIIVSDAEGIERYVSPSVTRVLGYQPGEFLSRSQYLLHHPDDRDRVRALFFDFVKNRQAAPITFTWRFLHKNGTYRWVEATASNQLNNPHVAGIILNVRDVTERKNLENALREAKENAEADAREIERSNLEIRLKNRELNKLNEEKNELIQLVSHDLKNPLFGLQDEARAILAHPNAATDHARRVLLFADRMHRLITNLLGLHAIESGRMHLHPEAVDVRERLSEILNIYDEKLQAKHLTVCLPSTTATARADREALGQVLDNLLSNAIKYSPPGGTVRVTLAAEGESVLVRVQDEGAGVPLDEADRLFQKFTRLSTKPTAGEHSNGLGLALTKKLVYLLHGDIWYEHHPGKGATFAVELPVAGE